MYYVYVQHFQQEMDEPGKVANPARGPLNKNKKKKSLSPWAPFAPEKNFIS